MNDTDSAPAELLEYHRTLTAGADAFGVGSGLLSPFRDGVIDSLNAHCNGQGYIAKGGC